MMVTVFFVGHLRRSSLYHEPQDVVIAHGAWTAVVLKENTPSQPGTRSVFSARVARRYHVVLKFNQSQPTIPTLVQILANKLREFSQSRKRRCVCWYVNSIHKGLWTVQGSKSVIFRFVSFSRVCVSTIMWSPLLSHVHITTFWLLAKSTRYCKTHGK